MDELKNHPLQNYLQIRGVQPGRNILELRLESLRGLVVKSVKLLPSTAIRHGVVGPPRLEAELYPVTTQVRAGTVIRLDYHVTTRGLPIREVEVYIYPDRNGVAPMDSWRRTHHWVIDDTDSIRFLALEPGTYSFRLRAIGDVGGMAETTTQVRVLDYDD